MSGKATLVVTFAQSLNLNPDMYAKQCVTWDFVHNLSLSFLWEE